MCTNINTALRYTATQIFSQGSYLQTAAVHVNITKRDDEQNSNEVFFFFMYNNHLETINRLST